MTGGEKDAYKLVDKISSAWINYGRTGNSNTKNLPEWAPDIIEIGATMIFDNKRKVVYNHEKVLLDLVSLFQSGGFSFR